MVNIGHIAQNYKSSMKVYSFLRMVDRAEVKGWQRGKTVLSHSYWNDNSGEIVFK